ncbi:MAG: c-type cytochrome [Chloroflexi bacterium]|nr:c-type cytochrome [Chloroflexota bacterium]
MRESENPDLITVLFLAGSVALIAAGLAAMVVAAGGREAPVPTPSEVTASLNTPPVPDVTFYVMAYHWDYAIFAENGSRLDMITVPQGTTLEIYAVNALAKEAIARLPAPVVKAMGEVPHPDAEAMLAAEPGPHPWSVTDHGFLLEWYGVVEYLASGAQKPNRVVFTADRPGEYQFVCANYCGVGHTHMTMQTRFIVEPEGLLTPTPTLLRNEPPPDAEFGLHIFEGDAGVVSPPCTLCHAVGRDVVGPNLAGVATRAAKRVEGLAAAEYLQQAVLEPRAYVVESWSNIMPSYQGQMTDDQLKALIAYLMTLE